MKIYEYDAVVVGSGCAGYNCADALYDNGVTKIAIVTEGKHLGTSRNTGSDKQTYYKLSLAGDEGDSVMSMAQTLFSGGGMDGDVALAEAASSARCFLKLISLGVKFPTNEYGEFVGYKTDHDPFSRATSIGPYTSKKMTEVLEESVEKKGIAIFNYARAVEVILENNGVAGLLCMKLDGDKRELFAIKTPHVVLATGGPASVYRDSVYPLAHTGSSSLALNAGAVFSNLSEWQYGLASTDFRWNVSGTYMQVLPRFISVDSEGVEREFLNELGAEEALKCTFLKGYEWPFDVRKINGSSRIDLLVYRETAIYNRTVYLDFTREPSGLQKNFQNLDKRAYDYLKNSEALLPLPIERLKKMNAGAVELYKKHGIDLEKQPLKIAVCAQHNNGGIGVDKNWQTSVNGLYAVGEAAGTLGIFRPGGSALNSCQVGALRAARHIAFFSKRTPSEQFDKALFNAKERLEKLLSATHGGVCTLASMKNAYQSAMSVNFAFLRNVEKMKQTLAKIEEWEARFPEDNRWEKEEEIPALLRNLEIIEMQRAIASAMLFAAENFRSRGSAFVYDGGDFFEKEPLPEREEGRGKIVTTKKQADKIEVGARAVRPIPRRELWFEKVWNEYRRTEER